MSDGNTAQYVDANGAPSSESKTFIVVQSRITRKLKVAPGWSGSAAAQSPLHRNSMDPSQSTAKFTLPQNIHTQAYLEQ